MAARRLLALAFALGLVAAVAAPALAHEAGESSGVSVDPTQLTAGGTVVLAGRGLEPDSDRVLQLVGHDLIVQFGTVTTDADGGFAKELTIPAYLPAGAYELQAIGDETLATPLAVTVAAGAAANGGVTAADAAVAPRARSSAAMAGLVLAILLVAALGVILVRGSERLGRRSLA